MGEQGASPGWYPVRGGQRYWDGQAWTEHFTPDPAPVAQPIVQRVVIAGPSDRIQTNHVFHLLMSILTFGLWTPVWALVAFSNAQSNARARRQALRNAGR
ncbi:DUF2510 domain-containing protein [Pedococcus badiiscoriae]|uniref:DUF2510 domain-containing protein n=1 Tax=Pedococcus badiiscoriae TaxID=642776 RepID=UPI0015CDA395